MKRAIVKTNCLAVFAISIILLQVPWSNLLSVDASNNEHIHCPQKSIIRDMTTNEDVDEDVNYYKNVNKNVSNVLFYYETKAKWTPPSYTSCHGSTFARFSPPSFGVSLIYKTKVNKKEIPISSDTLLSVEVLANLLSTNNSSLDSIVLTVPVDCGCNGHYVISDYLQDISNMAENKSVKLGIEYEPALTASNQGCCSYDRLDICPFMHVDIAILKLDLGPRTTMLSYGLFSYNLNMVISIHREKMEKINPNVCLYVRHVYSNWHGVINETKLDRYGALVNMFLTAWIAESTGQETHIVSTARETPVISDNNEFLKRSVSTIIYFDTINREQPWSKDKNVWACESREAIRFLRTVYSNDVAIVNPTAQFLANLLIQCEKQENPAQYFDLKQSDISIIFSMEHAGGFRRAFDQTNKALRNLSSMDHIPLRISNVYLDHDFLNVKRQKMHSEMMTMVKLVNSRGIKTGCYVYVDFFKYELPLETRVEKFIGDVVKECGPLIPLQGNILSLFLLNVDSPENLLYNLTAIRNAKEMFEAKYPEKRIIPILQIETVNAQNEPIVSQSPPLYCSYDANELNEHRQAAITFANVHEWSHLYVETGYTDSLGLYEYVDTAGDIDRWSTKFPVFFRTNSEKPLGKKLPMTFACLNRTRTAESDGINFMNDQISGAIFELALRQNSSLTNMELETSLLFVLEKFAFTEIIVSSKRDLQTVSATLSPVFVGAIQSFHKEIRYDEKPLVYLEIHWEEFYLLQQDPNHVGFQSHIAVHVSGWEDYAAKSNDTLFSDSLKFPPMFGAAVQNCSYEINLKLSRLQKLPFLNKISYVVCNEQPVVPLYLDPAWMHTFFSNMFYKKTYIERFLFAQSNTTRTPNVIFRINLISKAKHCPRTFDTEIFLRFLNEVNQHGTSYGIKYFLVRAFSKEAPEEKCPYSWWRLQNYTDLTNVSNYVDKEDEHFGRATKLRIQLPPQDTHIDGSTNTTLLVYVLVPIVSVLILGFLALWLYYRRAQKMLLSQREVQQFYNGAKESQDGMAMINRDQIDEMYMKFSKTFEIPAKDIETKEMIGCGQFGLVHKGILNKRLEVAIKTPREDCAKDQFLSTLSELKILSHMGAHEHLVSFLGAWTKEIAFGKLYIVMEFCAKGSLLNYLKEIRSRQAVENASGFVDLYQLNLFAQQIASGMEYIASKRVIHGDLATRNVLMTSELTCKVADFGLSRQLYELGEYKKTSKEPVPWKWLAPESLKDMVFSIKSDVWSYGVTVWEIFSLGQSPYPGKSWTENFVQELETGMRMGKPQFAFDNTYEMMMKCWSIIPEERPTFTVCKEYFAGQRNTAYLCFEDN